MKSAGTPAPGSFVRRYGFAAAAGLCVFAARLALASFMEDHAAFLLFTLPVAAAAIWGGLGPGLLVAGIGALGGSSLFLFGPFLTAPSHDGRIWLLELLLYLIASGAISWLGSEARKQRWAAIAYARELESSKFHQQETIAELKSAIQRVRMLSGLLPICASCKEIRDGDGNWRPVVEYVRDHSDAEFSHGLCPKCLPKFSYTEL